MEIRSVLKLLEAEDDIQKKGTDKRDLIQKYRDLIDHPTTDKFMREIAQRKLDKLLTAQQAEQEAAQAQAEYDAGSAKAPALNFQVNVYKGGDYVPLPQDQWGEIFLRENGKTLRYSQVIERLMPLNPFRIDFRGGSGQWLGDLSGAVWFHPEDEPETGVVNKALQVGGNIWVTAVDEGRYFRGGISEYYISFSKYKYEPKKARR